MFVDIPQAIRSRMLELEALDARDRTDGTERAKRLRQITPETGRFLAMVASMAPPGEMVELGTSAGYSTLWLSLAARSRGQRLYTFEVDPAKARLARQTFTTARVDAHVELHVGDARDMLDGMNDVAMCFMDLDKEFYMQCYELVVPRLVPGGLLVADNMTSHAADLEPFLEQVLADGRVDALVVPIGKGELLCRRLSG